MNAYIMAAGLATRLRPKTEKIPKCLLPVGSKPILEHWLNAIFETEEFDRIFINVYHCADAVKLWIDSYEKKTREHINIIDESSLLLGTAGTLFWHGYTGEDFMCVYSDTISYDFFSSMKDLSSFWKQNPDKPLAGIITFPMPDDLSAGRVEIDSMGYVTNFSEKTGDGIAAWAGMMFGRGDFFDHIKHDDKDLARDVFPRILGQIRVLAHVEAYDIGRGGGKNDSFSPK